MAENLMDLQYGNIICGTAVGEDAALTEELAGRIGGAFTYWLTYKVNKNPILLKICIGSDPRQSSESLRVGLLKGVAMFGAEGHDAGVTSSPAAYMATVMPQFDFDGAVMVTGGKSGAGMNGFKFYTDQGCVSEEEVAEILKLASKYIFIGEYYEERPVDITQIYAAYLRQMIAQELKDVPGYLSGLHVVVDAGSGSGGFFATDVLAPMGADIIGSQFLEPDGTFPGHLPDPEDKEAQASVSKAVTDNHADLGILFDSDADTSAVIGADGAVIGGDEIDVVQAVIEAARKKNK